MENITTQIGQQIPQDINSFGLAIENILSITQDVMTWKQVMVVLIICTFLLVSLYFIFRIFFIKISNGSLTKKFIEEHIQQVKEQKQMKKEIVEIKTILKSAGILNGKGDEMFNMLKELLDRGK